MQQPHDKKQRGRGSQFPYRAHCRTDREPTLAEIKRVASLGNDVLVLVNDMIFKAVRRISGSHTDENDIEEMVQNVRIEVIRVALPKFDAWRKSKAKISTYLFPCIQKLVLSEIRTRQRHLKRQQGLVQDMGNAAENLVAADTSQDARVAVLADEIMGDPERYLGKTKARVFQYLMDHPNMKMKDMAKALGYTELTCLCRTVRQIKQIIRGVAQEDEVLG